MCEKGYPKATAFLNQWKEMAQEIQQLQMRRESLMMLATDTAAHLTGMPRSDSPNLQKTQTYCAEMDELDRRIADRLKEADEKREEIGRVIRKLNHPTQEMILIMIFLENKPYSEITDLTRYKATAIYKIKTEGMKKVEKMLG